MLGGIVFPGSFSVLYTCSNLPSTSPIHPHGSYKQLIRTHIGFGNETHEHPNSQGLVMAVSLSACESSSWCNARCNNTACLHLQQLRRLLTVETLTRKCLVWILHAVALLDGGRDEIYNMFAPLFKSNLHLHLHLWLVTSYESLSPSKAQSAPKAASLWLAITPDEQGTPCELVPSGQRGLERCYLHDENNDTGAAAALGKITFNCTGIKINFSTIFLI